MQEDSKDKEQKFLPISRLIPNAVTLLGLCAGLSSIKYTLLGNWEISVFCIYVACLMDSIDGRLARMLGASSEFGAELDSLVDFLSFGVAPGLLCYFWSLKEVKVWGWAIVMLYVICMAIRLARFNVRTDHSAKEEEKKSRHMLNGLDLFFSGIPAPAAALMISATISATFEDLSDIFWPIHFITETHYGFMAYIAIVALMASSRIPTISLKGLRINKSYASPFTVMVAIYLIFLVTKPLFTVLATSLVYITIILPAGILIWGYLENKARKNKS